MKLKDIHIARMPGYEDDGFRLEGLSGGLNILVGPNASGKTTTARAIQGLLWPDKLQGISYPSLKSSWDNEGKTLLIEREGAKTHYQLDGVPGDAPPLPSAHLADCFSVTIDDLFEGSSGTDSGLALEVRKQMAGGFDLQEIRRDEFISFSPAKARQDATSLKKARTEAGRIQDRHRVLSEEEAEIEGLSREIDEICRAKKELRDAEKIKELFQTRDRIVEAEAGLNSFPSAMGAMRGNEGEVLSETNDNISGAEKELVEAQERIDEAQQMLADSNLPTEGIPTGKLSEYRIILEDLRTAEEKITLAQDETARLREELEHLQHKLCGLERPDRLEALDREALDRIEKFQRRYEEHREKEAAVKGRLLLLDEEQEMPDPADIRKAAGLLREWLRASADTSRDENRKLRFFSLVLLIVLGVVGVLLASLAGAAWLVLEIVPLLGFICLLRMAGSRAVDLRPEYERRYGKLSVEQPSVWQSEEIERVLDQLDKLLVKAEKQEASREEKRKLEAELESIRHTNNEIEVERGQINEQLGVAPDTSVLALTVLSGDVRAYHGKKTAHMGLEGELCNIEERCRGFLRELNDFFSAYMIEPAASYAEAFASMQLLADRGSDFSRATEQLATERRRAEKAQETLHRSRTKRQDLFDRIGLDSSDELGLKVLLEDFEEFTKQRDELEHLKRLELRCVEEMQSRNSDLLETAREDIDKRVAMLSQLIGREGEIQQRIGNIEGRLQEARSRHQLEEALVDVDRAREQFESTCEQALLSSAGQTLISQIEEEYHQESQPEVLRLASRFLEVFTHGRYRINAVDEETEQGALLAFDTVRNRGLRLVELSRGTRMQLLLAARLAFAIKNETGTPLPFVLDEVLSSTDPERFRAIAEALLQLVKEGRQVFYFSCQPSDGQAWKQIAEETGIGDFCLIELDKLQGNGGGGTAGGVLSQANLKLETIPRPSGRTMEEYFQVLGVEKLDPTRGSSSVHLAYLVDDPEVLCRLLQSSISSYGQLKTLASHGGFDAYVEDSAYRKIKARAAVIDAFADAWKIGRGLALHPEAIVKTCASDTFREQIVKLAEERNWDVKSLLEAIDPDHGKSLPRFRKKSYEDFREKLSEAGYFVPEEYLTEDQARMRVLAEVNDLVREEVVTAEEVAGLFDRLWSISRERYSPC